MADQVNTVEAIILNDNWPGVAVPPPFPVTSMTSAGVGHNAVHPRWDVGTKWELYCYGDQVSVGVSYRQGFSTLIYLRGSHDIAAAIAAVRTVGVVPDNTIVAATCTNMQLYTVTSDTDQTTHENGGLFAVAISTTTNDYYGWYWCGGVYPLEYITSAVVADTIATNNAVVASAELSSVALADQSGVGLRANAAASQVPGIGISLIIDA